VVLRTQSDTADDPEQEHRDALKRPTSHHARHAAAADRAARPADHRQDLREGLVAQPTSTASTAGRQDAEAPRDRLPTTATRHSFTRRAGGPWSCSCSGLARGKPLISIFELRSTPVSTSMSQLRFTFPSARDTHQLRGFRIDADRLRREYFPALIASKLASARRPRLSPPSRDGPLKRPDNRVIYPAHAPPRHVRGRKSHFAACLFRSGASQRFVAPAAPSGRPAGATGYDPDDPGPHRRSGRGRSGDDAMLAGVWPSACSSWRAPRARIPRRRMKFFVRVSSVSHS